MLQGRLTPGHARTLLSLSEEEQIRAAETIIRQGMTVRDAEKTKRRARRKEAPPPDPNREDIRQKLMERPGTKVVLEEKNGKGRIIIEFYSQEDANRIIQSLLA